MITYNPDGTLSPEQNLAIAIINQACTDYRKALRGKGCDGYGCHHVIEEVRRFFRSEYYNLLTKVDGEYLLEKLEKEYKEELALKQKGTSEIEQARIL